jgi:diguanylate cyclase (GGDEF)-like protein
MISILIGRIFHFLVPGGVLLLAGVLFCNATEIIHWRPIVAKILLLLVPATGLFVCWRFNKVRPALAILVLLITEWGIHRFCRGINIDPRLASEVRNVVTVLLPLNLAWLALGREKGLLNLYGFLKLAVLFGQLMLVAAVFVYRPDIVSLFGTVFIDLDISAWTKLAQPAIAAYLICLVVLLANLLKRQGAIDTGFIWALVASYLGLAVYSGLLSTICLATAGMIMAVSVVEAAYSMAYRDELTGLPGRRALNEMLRKLHGNYAVAMMDIDFFKKFNDKYGHDVGDQVLKMVATRISRVAGGGRAFRFGGEEFTVVFPGRHADQVVFFLDKLRRSVEDAGFTFRRPGRVQRGKKSRGRNINNVKNVGVTISIGVASRESRKSSPEDVMKKADQALYKAKKGGRNKVVS